MIAADIKRRLAAMGSEWGYRITFSQPNTWSVNVNNGKNWFPVQGDNLSAVFTEALHRAEAFVKEGVR